MTTSRLITLLKSEGEIIREVSVMSHYYKTGVIHGRFQGLHYGHMEYLLEAKRRCEHLVVGITNYTCSEKNQKISAIDTHRLNEKDNPFSYYHRMKMVEGALLDAGIKREEFDVVPFPVERPDKIANFVPENAVYFMTIYDDWGIEKKKILESLNLKVEVMWAGRKKVISGSLVREKIRNNEEWKNLVPFFVFEYINELKKGGMMKI